MPQPEAPIDRLVKKFGPTAILIGLLFWLIVSIAIAFAAGSFIASETDSQFAGYTCGFMIFGLFGSFLESLPSPKNPSIPVPTN